MIAPHDKELLLGITFAISSLPSIGAERRSGVAGIDGVACDPLKRTARLSARRARAATARRERASQVTLVCSWVTDGASQTSAPARRTVPLFERCGPDFPCPARHPWLGDLGILPAVATADRRHAHPSVTPRLSARPQIKHVPPDPTAAPARPRASARRDLPMQPRLLPCPCYPRPLSRPRKRPQESRERTAKARRSAPGVWRWVAWAEDTNASARPLHRSVECVARKNSPASDYFLTSFAQGAATVDGMDAKDKILQRMLKDVGRPDNRSPLFWWLLENHDGIIAAAAGQRLRWHTLCAYFETLGLTDTTGKAPTLRNARETWAQVRREVARLRLGEKAAAPTPASPSRLPATWRPVEVNPNTAPPRLPARVSVDDETDEQRSRRGQASILRLRKKLAERSGRNPDDIT